MLSRHASRNVGFAARFGQERPLPRGIALLDSGRWGSNASRATESLGAGDVSQVPGIRGSAYTVRAYPDRIWQSPCNIMDKKNARHVGQVP